MTRKAFAIFISFILAVVLTSSMIVAEGLHKIEFHQRGVVNGVYLKPGLYRLQVNADETITIFRGKESLVSAKVKIEPLGRSMPKSISQEKDGTVKEIRLTSERLVLMESKS
jgi:hypothetical protein